MLYKHFMVMLVAKGPVRTHGSLASGFGNVTVGKEELSRLHASLCIVEYSSLLGDVDGDHHIMVTQSRAVRYSETVAVESGSPECAATRGSPSMQL